MNAYVYQAALWCEACALDKRAELKCSVAPDYREDSNDWPQGPYADGGGEADSPQHCDGCSVFLENPLTHEGLAYVANEVANANARRVVLQQWRTFYIRDWPGVFCTDLE